MDQSNESLELDLDLPIDADQADVAHLHWRISKNLTRRIDQYLVDRVGYLSRAQVQRVIDDGLVQVNGRVIKASYRPRAGDEVEMVAPPEPISEIVPEPIPLEILYEDDDLLALNKQADIIVHPARGKWTGTLVNGLVHYGKKWSSINGNWRPGILHRLDRNTTGVMLVAKSDEAHWRVARQFETRTIQKTYLAVCHGRPQLDGDVIDMPIGRDKYTREKQAVRKEEYGGKPATTIYQVLETFKLRGNPCGAGIVLSPSPGSPGEGRGEGEHEIRNPKSEIRKFPLPNPLPEYRERGQQPPQRSSLNRDEVFSLIKLSPKTGRTHQLRVHLSTRGYPIVADTVYGGRVFERGDFRLDRQALHAAEITFVHPITLQSMTIKAPLPPDMQRLLEILRGAGDGITAAGTISP